MERESRPKERKPRPKTRKVWVVFPVALLEAFDAIVPPKNRSWELQGMVRERVLRHQLGDALDHTKLEAVLALLD